MKILFIDAKSIQNSIRIGLLEQMAHHEVHLIGEEDEAMDFYVKESPDMVLVDFSVQFGLKILCKILDMNPLQPVISISDSLDCAEVFGCDFCLEHYNKKRLLKHQSIHDLLYLIDNFEEMPCEFAHKFEACASEDGKSCSAYQKE